MNYELDEKFCQQMAPIMKDNTEYCAYLQVELTMLNKDNYLMLFYVCWLGPDCSVAIQMYTVVMFDKKMSIRLSIHRCIALYILERKSRISG